MAATDDALCRRRPIVRHADRISEIAADGRGRGHRHRDIRADGDVRCRARVIVQKVIVINVLCVNGG